MNIIRKEEYIMSFSENYLEWLDEGMGHEDAVERALISCRIDGAWMNKELMEKIEQYFDGDIIEYYVEGEMMERN
jgi:hypothetical protein